MPHHSSNREDSPITGADLSTRRNTHYNEKSPPRRRSSRRSTSPVAIYNSRSGRSLSPKREERLSSPQLSPSPPSKRLRRAQDSDYSVDRERERSSRRRERDISKDRSEKRSYKDINGNKSVKHGRDHSVSPTDRRRRSKHKSTSPPEVARNGKHEQQLRVSHNDENDDSIAKMNAAEQDLDAKQKQKPSFELSGKLAAETNRVRGVTLLFSEPSDAGKPDIRWRLYVFKAGEVLTEPLYIHRQSCYLFGRERRVADIPTDHPSCSKQHAVIQFRLIEKEQADGMLSKKVRPYLMDLGSTNKTFLNDNPIEPQRFYELFEKDTVRFGNSSREYVLLHENSAQ